MTLQRAAGKRAPPRSGPLPRAPDYKGVSVDSTAQNAAVFKTTKGLGRFCAAEEATRAYDDAARMAGHRVVNFPRPGTDEVQAVKGEKQDVTLLRAAGERLPPRSGPLPPASNYKGVSVNAQARTAAEFAAYLNVGITTTFLGSFCTAEEAARAYDDAARKTGRLVVNFPRHGTDEVQAVKGERDAKTLARHASQQAAGGAGGGVIAPPGTASPPAKRRAAVPPPSELPPKRAPAPGIKTEMAAAAAPKEPAAPVAPTYKRRPPHRIGPAASPDDGPGVDAPTSGIKTESPAAVKPEAHVAPPPARYTRRPPHRIERESSLPPGFVAPAPEMNTPAAVKPEAPAAPPSAPFTRRPPHRIDTAATPPPEPDAPALGIKTETPAAAVKAETSAAPPAAATSGMPSPAPPSASAAAAPPVKMEHD